MGLYSRVKFVVALSKVRKMETKFFGPSFIVGPDIFGHSLYKGPKIFSLTMLTSWVSFITQILM
jgi:hypothetical protein